MCTPETEVLDQNGSAFVGLCTVQMAMSRIARSEAAVPAVHPSGNDSAVELRGLVDCMMALFFAIGVPHGT
jgi:hypothetical protein